MGTLRATIQFKTVLQDLVASDLMLKGQVPLHENTGRALSITMPFTALGICEFSRKGLSVTSNFVFTEAWKRGVLLSLR